MHLPDAQQEVARFGAALVKLQRCRCKAVEKLDYLGGAYLQAVSKALAWAGKLPELAEAAASLRSAGRSLQEAQRSTELSTEAAGRVEEGPEQ